MSPEQILQDANAALSASQQADPEGRRSAMTELMRCFELLAREVSADRFTWDEGRAWAREHAEQLRSAHQAVSDWSVESGRLLDNGEEGVEQALIRRSQRAFARELFRDTSADEFLSYFEDDEMDLEYRETAERLALDAPDFVPCTHTWWRWKNSTGVLTRNDTPGLP